MRRSIRNLSNTLLGVLIVLAVVAFAFVAGVLAIPVLIVCCAYAGFYVVGEDIVEFIRSNWPGEEGA